MAQLVTRIDDELLRALDALVADGAYASRSEIVRVALQEVLDARRRAEVGRQIVDGYRRAPQTEAELGWADEATIRMIAEEPW